MMVKNPVTKVVINKDESHYEVLKLRRAQRKQSKKIEEELQTVNEEMKMIKEILKSVIENRHG